MYTLSAVNFEMFSPIVYWMLPFSHTFLLSCSSSLLIQTSEMLLMASTAHLMILTSDADFLLFLNLKLPFQT